MAENTLFVHLPNILTFTKLDIEKLPIENDYYKTDIYIGTAEISLDDPSLYYTGIFDDNKNNSVNFFDDHYTVFKCNEESGYEILINKQLVSTNYNSIAKKYNVQVNNIEGLYIELLKNESRYKTIFLKRIEEINDVNSIKYAKFEVYLNLNMEVADYEYYMVFSLNRKTLNGADYYYNYNTDNNDENILSNICEKYIENNKVLLIYMNEYINNYNYENIPIYFYFPIMNGYYIEDMYASVTDIEFRNISLLNNPTGEDYIKDASFTDYLVYPNHTYQIPENATITLKIIEYNTNSDTSYNTRVSTYGESLLFKPDATVMVDLTTL